jgi:putative phosphoesterase
MKIGIISDIHENSANLRKAFDILKDNEIERVVCLGDLINPGIAKILAAFDVPVFSIWGNNDGDKVLITKISLTENSSLEMSDRTYAFLEYDGCSLFISHYPELAEPMAASGKFDIVCYGHDHKKSIKEIDGTMVLNPGELSGLLTGFGTFAIYDTVKKEVEFFEVA